MRKNKFFIKRKNTRNSEVQGIKEVLEMIGFGFGTIFTLGCGWLIVCLMNTILN
jgi:hypothetical protein